jgi:hypothetical protein
VIVDLRALGPHEVVVQARRSVISPGTELAHYRGESLVGLLPPAQRPHQPFHPGYAMAGTVLAAGLDSGFAAGTSVLPYTPHQSVVRFDPRQQVCLPLPAGIGPDIAPFARLGQIGGISLRLAAARPADTVAVIGLGPVGNLVAQLAQASGYRVVSVERWPGRRELARPAGLSTIVAPEEAGDAVAPAGATASCWSAQAASTRSCSPPRSALAGAEYLCHQAIFVDDATRTVKPLDPEVVQVGDAIWQGPQWRGLAQRTVRPVRIVEVFVLPQHRHEVALVPDQGSVQQFSPAAAYPPLHDRIAPHRQLHPIRTIGTDASG